MHMQNYLKLNKANCKNCYKCIRHCPVKSIRFSGHQAHIVDDECVLCGECLNICPQKAKTARNDLETARMLVAQNEKVYASIAPSFIANYRGVTIEAMDTALKKLGFYAAEETAIGATIVKRAYEEMVHEKTQPIIISTCCHSVNLLVQKHFPAAIPYLAPVLSPMQAHAAYIKQNDPEAKVIFIGPCLAKKAEADLIEGLVDCVLTYPELTQWMAEEGVVFDSCKDTLENSRARLFPTVGGILRTMDKDESSGYSYLSIDGQENCVKVIEDILSGGLTNCFIEMSMCPGSCVGGSVTDHPRNSSVLGFVAVDRYAGKEDFLVSQPSREALKKTYDALQPEEPMPSEEEIREILKKIGKTKPEDELNCGTCGYNTCREKAIAVYQGKADLTMCLPFLKDKAESFSDNIIRNTPNAIIVLNEALEVQQINSAACDIMNIRQPGDVMGEPIVRILDPGVFLNVMEHNRRLTTQRTYLAEYRKYVDETIVYDKEYHLLICIMRDVTAEETDRQKKEEFSRQTIETTDKVIEKQMRVVQEIASLLGETTAETKIALTKLKESMRDE